MPKVKQLGKQKQIPRDLAGRMFANMAATRDKIRNLDPAKKADVEKLSGTLFVCAVTHCGADPTKTSELVWPEVFEQAQRFFGDLTPDEFLEAFRQASAGRWKDKGLNFNAYRGQFTVKILCDVMNYYNDERKLVRADVESLLGEMTKSHLQRAEEKNRLAREKVVKDFLELRTAIQQGKAFAPDYDKTKAYWADTLADAGIFEEIDIDEKRELWKRAGELAQSSFAVPGKNQYQTNHLRGLLQKIKEGAEPKEYRDRRKTAYSKLLIIHALNS